MLLSEALRLGEFTATPIKGSWFRMHEGKVCGACAVGRVCLVVGHHPSDDFKKECRDIKTLFDTIWPWTISAPCKVDYYFQHTGNTLADKISYMYEYERMTMQEIADWVATIEPKEHHDLQPITDQNVSHMPHSQATLAGGVDQ